jgi:hypothetical protein
LQKNSLHRRAARGLSVKLLTTLEWLLEARIPHIHMCTDRIMCIRYVAFIFSFAGSLFRFVPERRSAPRHGLLPRRRVPPPNAVSGMPSRSRARPPPPRAVTASGRPRPELCSKPSQRARPSSEAEARPELGAEPSPHCGMPPRRAQRRAVLPPWSRTGVPAANFTTEPRPQA